MPLDGFRIVDWAALTFGGLPSTVLGGLGFALLVAGIILAAIGFKLAPISYSLIAAGFACAVLTYFIVGAAIAGAGTHIEGNEQVTSAAASSVPAAAATLAIGLALFGGRLALRLWSGEEASGKVMAVLVLGGAVGLGFVGVQVMRGASSERATVPAAAGDENAAPASDDGPMRRAVTGTNRR